MISRSSFLRNWDIFVRSRLKASVTIFIPGNVSWSGGRRVNSFKRMVLVRFCGVWSMALRIFPVLLRLFQRNFAFGVRPG